MEMMMMMMIMMIMINFVTCRTRFASSRSKIGHVYIKITFKLHPTKIKVFFVIVHPNFGHSDSVFSMTIIRDRVGMGSSKYVSNMGTRYGFHPTPAHPDSE